MAYCKNCGNEIEEGALFCAKCGQRIDTIGILEEDVDKIRDTAIFASPYVTG